MAADWTAGLGQTLPGVRGGSGGGGDGGRFTKPSAQAAAAAAACSRNRETDSSLVLPRATSNATATSWVSPGANRNGPAAITVWGCPIVVSTQPVPVTGSPVDQ